MIELVNKFYQDLVRYTDSPQDASEILLRLHVKLYVLTSESNDIDRYLKIYDDAFKEVYDEAEQRS